MRPYYALLLCLLVGSSVYADPFSTGLFRFWKPVEREATETEEIVGLALDSEIYANTRAGYPDVRLLDDEQNETPYLLEAVTEMGTSFVRDYKTVEIVKLEPTGNNLVVHLRLPADMSQAYGLRIFTSLKDFERRVQVEGSADGLTWVKVSKDSLLFDYTRYMDVRNLDVVIPSAIGLREFKLSIWEPDDERELFLKEITRTTRDNKAVERNERTLLERRPFRIEKIQAWQTVTKNNVKQAKTLPYPIRKFDVESVPTKKQSIVNIETNLEPITQLTLQTQSRNFSRQVCVEVPTVVGGTSTWRSLAEATLEQLSYREYQREQLTITFPEHRVSQYRLVIQNEDNPVLQIQGVQASGTLYRLVFLAQPKKSYRVYYDSETAQPPKYDAPNVLAAFRSAEGMKEVKLGPQAMNETFEAPVVPAKSVLDNWLFLGIVLGVLVVVLGWTLLRAGPKLESLSRE